MADLIPYLTFRHGDESLRFLSDGLGFELVAVQRHDDGAVAHAELRRGEAIVMGGSGDVDAGAAPGLYLVAEDVDRTFERAVTAGAEVVFAPEETEWGTKRALPRPRRPRVGYRELPARPRLGIVGRLAEQQLHHQHIAPIAVKSPVAEVQADLAEAVLGDEAAA
jgi:uncharacterized glyoxalase superfamily protein PhnB